MDFFRLLRSLYIRMSAANPDGIMMARLPDIIERMDLITSSERFI